MKKQVKHVKLELGTETIRNLSANQLQQVAGAAVSAQTYVAGSLHQCKIPSEG